MAGQLHGEVLTYARWLRAAGLSRNAIDALSVIAEGCRFETRRGAVSRDRIADKLFATERTADRALRELRDRGLIEIVQHAGGRGRGGLSTVYEMAVLREWFTTVPRDNQVSHPSTNPPETVRHDDVASIGAASIDERDRCDKSGPSARHLGVAPPVVPVTTSGGTTEVTTRPHASRTPPPDHPREPAPRPTGSPSARSRCGRPDCRAPAPCGACGRARRADRDAEQRAQTAELDRQALARARQLEERRAARASCPNGCQDGYLPGGWVCDHRRRTADLSAVLPGRLDALAVAAAAARSARSKTGHPVTSPAPRGRRRRPLASSAAS